MSLATELQKLKNLRDSGAITREEYDTSRNQLLEQCVRQIESVHDRNPDACVAGSPAPGPASPSSQAGENPPLTVNRSSAYSEELDYSLVTPARRTVSKPESDDGASTPSPEAGVPRAKFSQPPVQAPSSSRLDERAAEIFQNETPAPPAAQPPSSRVAYETVKFVPASQRVEQQRQIVPEIHQFEFSAPDPPQELDLSQVATVQPDPAFQRKEIAALAEAAPIVDDGSGAPLSPVLPENIAPAEVLPASAAPASSPDEFLPSFAKSSEKLRPAERSRWGVPRFKLVTGVVQDVRLSLCQNSEAYAASMDLDGQQMEITSSSEIRIAAGDRVSLGGYEREGQLLVLGYRNETNGSHSDLTRLRKRYRFLLTIGRLSLIVGLAALAATVMLFLRQPVWASHFARWGYLPYLLSGLLAAAASYFGLALSFVGNWAKEFHSALAPPSTSHVPQNPPSALPATY
jgi:Short C-terminal domain